MQRAFAQVDVFTTGPGLGNPLAVVLEADGLTTAQMQRFATWTNLSETTFLVPPADGRADYAVRIFTPQDEIPFAGHPTLGSCHAWLEAGGVPRDPGRIVQECGTGLVEVRRDGEALAFLEPPMLRWGPVDEADLVRVARSLAIRRDEILDATWCDNGPGWMAVLLESAARVLEVPILPTLHLDLGIVGLYPAGSDAAIEVRGAWPEHGSIVEDPATGSLNASVARWLIDKGLVRAPYTATQGAAIGRAARIEITQDADGTILVGGRTVTVVRGTADLQGPGME
jgi:PhzF family phenazine biosynthesis protein